MEPLKNIYSTGFVASLAELAQNTLVGFDAERFQKDVFDDSWQELELKQRIRQISTALGKQFTGDFLVDIVELVKLSKVLHQRAGRDNMFEYMFLPDYIEQNGSGHITQSLDAMEVITILSSCEFAIRPFLMTDTDTVMAKMLEWTKHQHPSVRRLASEGCRPRLPWGMALPDFKKDPTPILPVLETLKNDESEFVRKSVANNLNDISKDNPHIVLDIARSWLGSSKHTDWIVKHACRTLLKAANTEALTLFGLSVTPQCAIRDLLLRTDVVSIGDKLEFSFCLMNNSKAEQLYRLEYVITYVKANNKHGKKKFKITENKFKPGTLTTFARKQSFADMTTRKHYPGRHKLAITVNGVEMAEEAFTVA